MASIRRLARTIRTCRTIAFAKTLSLSPSPRLQLALYNRTFEQHKQTYGSQGPAPRSVHAILAGLLGFGLIDITYADDNKDTAETSPPEFPPTLRHNNIEEIARKEKVQLEELLKSKRIRYGSHPRFTVAVKGQKVTIKFQVLSACEIPLLIANLVSRLGIKVEDNGQWYWIRYDVEGLGQLTLSCPKNRKETNQDQIQGKDINANDRELCILMFRPLIGSDKAEIEFMKQGSFSTEELDALASVLQLAGQQKSLEVRPSGDASSVQSIDKTVSSLEGMGVKVYGLTQSNVDQPKADISWDNIAGYNHQK